MIDVLADRLNAWCDAQPFETGWYRPLFILAVYTGGVPWMMPDGTPGERAAAYHIARLCRACWDALKREEAPAYTGR